MGSFLLQIPCIHHTHDVWLGQLRGWHMVAVRAKMRIYFALYEEPNSFMAFCLLCLGYDDGSEPWIPGPCPASVHTWCWKTLFWCTYKYVWKNVYVLVFGGTAEKITTQPEKRLLFPQFHTYGPLVPIDHQQKPRQKSNSFPFSSTPKCGRSPLNISSIGSL